VFPCNWIALNGPADILDIRCADLAVCLDDDNEK